MSLSLLVASGFQLCLLALLVLVVPRSSAFVFDIIVFLFGYNRSTVQYGSRYSSTVQTAIILVRTVLYTSTVRCTVQYGIL